MTTYRLMAQPEMRELVQTLEETRRMSKAIAQRAKQLPEELAAQEDRMFKSLREQRTAAVAQAFDGFASERKALLDDLAVIRFIQDFDYVPL